MVQPDARIEVPTTDGAAVRGDLYVPADRTPSGIVILCHGFKGYKTWGFFPYIAGRLRDAGIAALAIDFSFNGTFPERDARENPPAKPGSTRYPRADLFRMNTLRRETGDLAATLRSLARDGFGGRIDGAATVGLFGHSRGGVSAILAALQSDRVKTLCTWSTPDHPDHFTARQKAVWRRCGEFDLTEAIDGTCLSLSVTYLDDIEKNHDLYDLRSRVGALRVPHLIVHGEMDLAVPVRSAHSLHDAEGDLHDKGLLIVRAGHTFGVSDPPGMDPDHPPRVLTEVCDATVEWFESHLTKGK